jgi:hypothetical protein
MYLSPKVESHCQSLLISNWFTYNKSATQHNNVPLWLAIHNLSTADLPEPGDQIVRVIKQSSMTFKALSERWRTTGRHTNVGLINYP